MNQITFLIASMFSICLFSPLYSQQWPPPKDLVDSKYYEGYRTQENIGAAAKLISFLAQHTREISYDSSLFNIGFLVPTELTNKDIDIFIEDRNLRSYYMIPVQKRWPAGRQTFTWNSKRAADQNIGLFDMFGLAKLKDSDFGEKIIPITFYYSHKPAQIEHYEFVFVVTLKANLKYTIFDEAEKEVAKGVFRDQPRNKNIIIKWDIKNASAGKYTLLIEYILKNGKRVRGESTFEFYHNQ